MKKRYEEPDLKIISLHCENILTESQESILGDGWAEDPFEEK